MGLMAAARDAPHDEILVERFTRRHRFQLELPSSKLDRGVLMYDDSRSLRSRIRLCRLTPGYTGPSRSLPSGCQFLILCLDWLRCRNTQDSRVSGGDGGDERKMETGEQWHGEEVVTAIQGQRLP